MYLQSLQPSQTTQSSQLPLQDLLLKATSVQIIRQPSIKKHKLKLYTLIFKNIPYITKKHERLLSEIILSNCTFEQTPPLIIPNFQSFIYNNDFKFNYYKTPTTPQTFTLQLKEN